ncbi:MAG: TRAP transporter large permease subunit [Tissierellales bacterium]|nr:TRAP transporter large permease subunit [Tissierellales bacterium]
MPIEILYIVILLALILIVFVGFKRPIYEAMFIGLVILSVITGNIANLWKYLITPSTNTLFFAIVEFLALAYIFSKTNVIDDIVNFIISIVGRFRGGAGYASLISSTFMASLSGTGPGNVVADGVFTIPTMIKSNFPRELAATVEMSASSLGPILPPSGTILLAFGVLDALYPNDYNLSSFWIVVWGIGIWFILQRLILLYILCRKYNVNALDKNDIPNVKESFKKGWKALIIPIIIFAPFLIDFTLGETFIASRLGEDGANAFSSSVILFAPAIAAIYTFLIAKYDKSKKDIKLRTFFKGASSRIVPVAATIYFAYSLSALFTDINLAQNLGEYINSFNMGSIGLGIFFPIFTMILGMFLPGSSQVAIFGGIIVASLSEVGLNPLLIAALLPAITGGMEGMTPPLALALYPAVGIAGADMKKSMKLALYWVFSHLIVSILIILGILPVPFI